MSHPYLGQSQLHPDEQRRLERLLESAWFWPEEEGAELDHARRLARREAPPPTRPGEVLLLAVQGPERKASLWRTTTRPGRAQPLGRDATRAWITSADILPRVLPFLFSSVQQVCSTPPRIELLEREWFASDRPAEIPQADGESFGLALLLSFASRLLDLPVPVDLAASATVRLDQHEGAISPVEGLTEKLGLVERVCPSIRRLLVAERQDHPRGAGRIEFVPCRTAGEAIQQAFPDLADKLVETIGGTQLAQRLFELALKPRRESIDWSPIAATAGLALERCQDLSGDLRRGLEFSRAVALRHQDNKGCLGMPDPEWLSRMPEPRRLCVLAHHVQQSVETGSPESRAILDLVEPRLVVGLDAFPGHLKLLGATGRLYLKLGDAERALACQREAAVRWLDLGVEAVGEITYPLSAWLLCARAANRPAEFGEAAELCRRAEQMHLSDGADWCYVDLALAACQVEFQLASPEQSLRSLADSSAPVHVRLSARRWLIRLLERESRSAEAEQEREMLASPGAAPESEQTTLEIFRALVGLDDACLAGDPGRAERAVGRLRDLQPGMVEPILARAPADPLEGARALARAFPY